MTSSIKIAAGHDNTAGLTTLADLSSPSFARYKNKNILTQWHDYEGRVRDGLRNWRTFGRPWCSWIFQGMTMTEYQLLKSNFAPLLALNGDVTITTFNKTLNAYLNYNAKLTWPNEDASRWVRGDWADVKLDFTELAQITGFSSGFDPLAHGVT